VIFRGSKGGLKEVAQGDNTGDAYLTRPPP
jgi:hypothetical protein